MTVKEWRETDGRGFTAEWAADTPGGFGRKGWTAYGNVDNCEIIRMEERGGYPHLVVWDPFWGPCPD